MNDKTPSKKAFSLVDLSAIPEWEWERLWNTQDAELQFSQTPEGVFGKWEGGDFILISYQVLEKAEPEFVRIERDVITFLNQFQVRVIAYNSISRVILAKRETASDK